jgi:hemolysin III
LGNDRQSCNQNLPMNEDFDQDLLPREPLLNTFSCALGLILALAGLPLLVGAALGHGGVWEIVSTAIYGATLVLAYTAFTLYHVFKTSARRTLFKILDHAAIYLLIAGTYTPFALVSLRGHGGSTLFAVIWSLAAAGIVFKVFFVHRFRILGPTLYVAMSWMMVVGVESVLEMIPTGGLKLLLAGGLCYTGGLLFYGIARIPYQHAIWHLWVVAGSLLHYLAIWYYVIPR